jgi:hypothetical protein
MKPGSPAGRVARRCVYYVSGFDPKGAAHYHALYRDEAAKQSQLSGMAPAVGPRKRLPSGDSFWRVSTLRDGLDVETHYEFLRWDDIVRHHWPRSEARLWWDTVVTTFKNLRYGSLWRMFKTAWPPVVVLVVPFLMVGAVALGLPLISTSIYFLTRQSGATPAIAALAGVGVLAAGLAVAWALERRYSMAWLMRSYAFTTRQAEGQTPELDTRLDQHARTLVQRVAAGVDDEILVVAHSSGAIMAASIVARAFLLDAELGLRGPRLSMMTLGQWLPLLGTLPPAVSFRHELTQLARMPGLDWIDFSAPPDGCCFALVDPIAACDIQMVDREPDRPKLLSPKFQNMFEAAEYRAIRRDRFRTHFQYLMAARKRVKYDYFAITAGELTLAERFKDDPSVTDYRDLSPFRRKT